MKNNIIIACVGIVCFVAGGIFSYGLVKNKLNNQYDLISKKDPISAYFWDDAINNVPEGVVYDRLVRTAATVSEGLYCDMFVGEQVQEKVTNPELRNILEEASKNKEVFREKMTDLVATYPELER
jgi:ABC-type microcin C transport system permease subunit YejB